jgi:hypothetical protein
MPGMTFYATEAGDKYHSMPECPGLVGGQLSAEAQDNQVRVIRTFPTRELAAAFCLLHAPCGTCIGSE